jgi:hypothetical protein
LFICYQLNTGIITVLKSQVMHLSNGLDDIEKKIPFTELESRIPDRDLLDQYGEFREGNNVLAGCRKKYQILQDIGVTDAMQWQAGMQNLLRKRNNSIYAHGISPIEKETAGKFLAIMDAFVQERFRDIQQKSGTPLEELFEYSRFPGNGQ